jgi:hypothetical protein
MSCHAATVLSARRAEPACDLISSCAACQGGYNRHSHFRLGGKIMDANIGLILVIGFPLALCLALWVFGKVSVRPD